MTRKNYKSLVKILARNNINFDDHAELIGSIMSWFKEDNSNFCKTTFENALKELALKAIRKKTGARGLRSILENILLKTMYDLPSQDNIDEVIVDTSAAKGQSQPIIVHSKTENKSKSTKTSAA